MMTLIKETLLISTVLLCSNLHGQVTVYDQDFDTLNTGSSLCSQISEFQPISGGVGGSSDPFVTSEHANSPENSVKINSSKDIFYSFGGQTSGHYSVEFNMFLHYEGYFNVQHDLQSIWACDVFFTDQNEILYQDTPNTSTAVVVGTYNNDEWIHFKFDIDIDNDVIKFYKNDTLLNTGTFSNSVVGNNSNTLDAINFYGLSGGFQNVNNSFYYIDDFKVINLSTSLSLSDQEENSLNLYPIPATNVLNLDQLPNDVRAINITDLKGKVCIQKNLSAQNESVDLTLLDAGIYQVNITCSNSETIRRKIIVNK